VDQPAPGVQPVPQEQHIITPDGVTVIRGNTIIYPKGSVGTITYEKELTDSGCLIGGASTFVELLC